MENTERIDTKKVKTYFTKNTKYTEGVAGLAILIFIIWRIDHLPSWTDIFTDSVFWLGIGCFIIVVFLLMKFGFATFLEGKDIDKAFVELKKEKIAKAQQEKKADFIVYGVGSFIEKKQDSEDKIWRYNPMQVALLNVDENALCIRDIDIDLIKPESYFCEKKEFLYSDIDEARFEYENSEQRFLIKTKNEKVLDIAVFNSDECLSEAQRAMKTINEFLQKAKQG